MKYVNNSLFIAYDELVKPDGPVPKGTYDWGKNQNKINVIGTGREPRYIEYDTMPETWQRLLEDKFGNVYEYAARQPLLRLVKNNNEARQFYAEYMLADGRKLPLDDQRIYVRQAEWLDMIQLVLTDKKELKEELNITVAEFWETVLQLIQNDPTPNELPTSEKHLRGKLKQYKEAGYGGLVSKHWNNQRTRKVDDRIENLIMSLYVMPDKPYFKAVCELYRKFILGSLQVIDLETAEVFDPQDFYVNGKPYEVKESTVKYYIDDKPLNRAIVDKVRMGALQWATKHQPHMIRKAPVYAFSKLTMDDTSSPFKQHNGDRPATYKAFDVASGAMVCMVMHKHKRPDTDLIRRLIANMFGLILRNGWKLPAEVEVENALMSEMKGKKDKEGNLVQQDVLSAGAVFPFVRFCAPRNPQEKRAEGFIKQIKYTYQKHREGFQFRPFASDANRRNEDSKWENAKFDFEEIYRFELEDMQRWNNSLHPNQEQYPGLTRWQVLEQHQNPTLVDSAHRLTQILPFVGRKAETSVDRQFVKVQYKKYHLGDMERMGSLSLVNNAVTAYYLQDDMGAVEHVHLYVPGTLEYICPALPIDAYQEARAERTDEDVANRAKQVGYRKEFDNKVKEGVLKLAKVGVIAPTRAEQEEEAAGYEGETTPNVQENEPEDEGFVQNSADENDWWNDEEAVKNRAIGDL